MSEAKHPLSRRALLTRAPAAAIAMAASANPLADASGQDHPDAMLFRRAAEYHALYTAADLVEARLDRLETEWERLKPERPPAAKRGTAVYEAWQDACYSVALHLGLPQAHEDLQTLDDSYSAIFEEMMAVPARTIQGLRIKAEIVRTHQIEIWGEALIDELIAFGTPDAFGTESG